MFVTKIKAVRTVQNPYTGEIILILRTVDATFITSLGLKKDRKIE